MGGGGSDGDTTPVTQTTPVSTPRSNSLSKFFTIPLIKEEWNNGIYSGGSTINRALGNGNINTYYNPTESNKTMELTERYFKQDNTQTEFFQRIASYQKQNEYRTAYTWNILKKDNDSVFVKTTYTDLVDKNVKFVEYLKLLLKNKKIYMLSLVYEEKFKNNTEIVKWVEILNKTTIESIKYTPIQIPRCIIDGNTVIGTEGKTCSDNSENTLTCNQTRPTLNGTLTAGPGKSIKVNGTEYSCQ